MSRICFVGRQGCGKTTALGLLYEAMIYYGSTNKNFQFEPEILSTRFLNENILEPMRAGSFPNPTPPGTREDVRLYFRFKMGLGWKEMIFDSYDISGEDIERALDEIKKSESKAKIVTDLASNPILVQLLNSDVFIFVVDSLDCGAKQNTEKTKEQRETDFYLQTLWLAIKAYKKATSGRVKGLALLFTKYDKANTILSFGDIEYQSIIDTNKQINWLGDKEKQEIKQNFHEVTARYFPNMFSTMKYRLPEEARNFGYFKSAAMTRTLETGKEGLYTPLSFSIREYIELIQWLRQVSKVKWDLS